MRPLDSPPASKPPATNSNHLNNTILLRDQDSDTNSRLNQRVYFTSDVNFSVTGVIGDITIKLVGFAILVMLLGSGCTQTATFAKEANLSDEFKVARLEFNRASTEEEKVRVVMDWCGVVNLHGASDYTLDLFDKPEVETKLGFIFCKIPGVSGWWVVIGHSRASVTSRSPKLYFG